MTIVLEPYDPQKHEQDKIATLIFESDVTMNRLVYGEKALEVLKKLLNVPESYFTPETMKCAMRNGELVGVVVYYPTSQMQAVDQRAGKGFMKALGFFNFIKRLSLYTKMEKMLGGQIDADGLYIHTLCVDGALRGQGIGGEIIRALAQENGKMYLYVNAANAQSIQFYKKQGFRAAFHGEMQHKRQSYAEYLMVRD